MAEDVTGWQGVEDSNGMEGALVLEILLHLLLNGCEAGEHVAVGVDDTFRIASGAGGEDDLEIVVGVEVIDNGGLLIGKSGGEIFEGETRGGGGEEPEFSGVADDAFGRDFAGDALNEIESAGEIDRDGDHSMEEATEEGGHPFGTVFAPDDEAVTFNNGAAGEFGGEAAREGGEFAICDAVLANAAWGDDGEIAGMFFEIGDEGGEIGARGNQTTRVCEGAGMRRRKGGFCGVELERLLNPRAELLASTDRLKPEDAGTLLSFIGIQHQPAG